MGYKIEYGQTIRKTTITDAKPFSLKKAILFSILLVLILSLCLGGTDMLKQVFIPGDPEITQAAFAGMMDHISEGMSVTDAFTAFCREIIQNAEVS